MRRTMGIVLFAGIALGLRLGSQPLFAQACKDDEAMVADYKKAMSDLVETVKKEKLEDFQKAFHQKSSLSKLTFYGSMVNGLLTCLDKATQDPTATKEDIDAYKAKHETYAKLKEKIDHDRSALKGAESARDAKALIEKFDLGT